MNLHVGGVLGLFFCFALCAWRPVNLGAACLGMTFVVGSLLARESVGQMLSGFPAELFVVLAGVTYLFAVAAGNGTVDSVVAWGTRALAGRRRLLPWGVFALAALPALCGSLGSAGVALLAPVALRLGRAHGIDPRLIGLMLVHGAGAGNFSPLNVLSLVVQQAAARGGYVVDPGRLFAANLVYNLALAALIAAWLGRTRPTGDSGRDGPPETEAPATPAAAPFGAEQVATLAAIVAVALVTLALRVNVGLAAFVAAVALQVAFPRRGTRAEEGVAWGVILLVCGVVTYVAALERFGTMTAAATAIAGVSSPAAGAFLVCALAAVTSAFASSAAILGAIVPLALPLLSHAGSGGLGLLTTLALSATVVDATPFSTVGALVVASAPSAERPALYRGLLLWGAVMVATAPPITWLLFVIAGIGQGGP